MKILKVSLSDYYKDEKHLSCNKALKNFLNYVIC